MKIKILAPTVINKEVKYEDDVVEVKDNVAAALIRRGRAVKVETLKDAKEKKVETATAEPIKEKATIEVEKRKVTKKRK